MPDIILAINAGSSSVKISIYKPSSSEPTSPNQIAEATISGLTAPPAKLKYTHGDQPAETKDLSEINSQEDAFRYILDHLIKDGNLKELSKKDDIKYTAHRVVHGGDYTHAQFLSKETTEHIEALSDLAPLHNGPALSIISAVRNLLPSATNIAFFDSAFHSSIPPHVYTYPINQDVARKNNLRKYGFHGLSYSYITRAVATHLKQPVEKTSIIALHLGSGASACAVRDGKSIDTSMGLTPLDGLPGATRSGAVDPSLIFHFTHDAGKMSHGQSAKMHITRAEEILNKESGWKALAGTTDFGEISEGKSEEQKLAFEVFVDRVVGFVANYFVKLGGRVDALVFAGGIGEKGERLRKEVVGRLECLGFAVDEKKNADVKEVEGGVVDVSAQGAKFRTVICWTDEQVEMARGVLSGEWKEKE